MDYWKIINTMLSIGIVSTALIAMYYQSRIKSVPRFPGWMQRVALSAIAFAFLGLLTLYPYYNLGKILVNCCLALIIVLLAAKAFYTHQAYRLEKSESRRI